MYSLYEVMQLSILYSVAVQMLCCQLSVFDTSKHSSNSHGCKSHHRRTEVCRILLAPQHLGCWLKAPIGLRDLLDAFWNVD